MKNKEIINRIQENIIGPQIVMIADRKGNILDCNIGDSIGKIVELNELSYIAKMISIRSEIADYRTLLRGLEMDVSIFADVYALTELVDKDRILIIVIPKIINLLEAINLISNVNIFKEIETELESGR